MARVFTTMEKRVFIGDIFNTRRGSIRVQCYAFRVKERPSQFSKTMTSVFTGYLGRFCGVYIDDVVVYSDTLADHFKHMGL